MSKTLFQGEFIEQAETIILENISNEQFGVSELADHMHMSRSNLLRKIKKKTQLSASQFIRLIRLQKGMDLLKETELTVSEISYQVGFGNNSYFIKCFREHYGYSPGEIRKGTYDEKEIADNIDDNKEVLQKSFIKQYRSQILIAASFIIIIAAYLFYNKTQPTSTSEKVVVKKSIAVLPFKNMSSDSTNIYFVNGLMESSLNNLQRIEDLRVISRTSVEKYRNTDRTISEIAEDLNVNYLVEGSGQRIGDQVLLNIQLIDASTDTPIWAEQYNYKVVDVFSLQNEVAKKIADAIKAKVTPSELIQINKKPTENLEAYDFYLKGLVPSQNGTNEGLKEAIVFFEKAIKLDPKFALAYSKLAISYYYLDLFQTKKQYTEIINNYADKALLYDSKSDQSLIAKALYYININEFRLAIPHLEKALEYNPNSSPVVQILADLYSRAIPDTSKYLKYALLGLQLDIDAKDSITNSYMYLALGNAFIQNGFTDQAYKYVNLSLDYNPNNYFSPYLKIFIEYAQHQNMDKTTKLLVNEFEKDTTRLDIMQEVAKFYYFQEKYDSAYYYYEKFITIKNEKDLNIYPQENLKIGIVYDKMGLKEQAKEFYQLYTTYCENDQSIYKAASLATKYAHEGNYDLAIEQYEIFATKNNYQYWVLLFLEEDPTIKLLKSHPKYDKVVQKIKNRFWENQNELKQMLEDKDLL